MVHWNRRTLLSRPRQYLPKRMADWLGAIWYTHPHTVSRYFWPHPVQFTHFRIIFHSCSSSSSRAVDRVTASICLWEKSCPNWIASQFLAVQLRRKTERPSRRLRTEDRWPRPLKAKKELRTSVDPLTLAVLDWGWQILRFHLHYCSQDVLLHTLLNSFCTLQPFRNTFSNRILYSKDLSILRFWGISVQLLLLFDSTPWNRCCTASTLRYHGSEEFLCRYNLLKARPWIDFVQLLPFDITLPRGFCTATSFWYNTSNIFWGGSVE